MEPKRHTPAFVLARSILCENQDLNVDKKSKSSNLTFFCGTFASLNFEALITLMISYLECDED